MDIWQCDARGVYSGVNSQGVESLFLRGYQISDASGAVRFDTIYPGWYPGRTPHIHFKIRVPQTGGTGVYDFTSQLFFDDTLSDRVYAGTVYSRCGRRTRNSTDGIYRCSGCQLLLQCTQVDGGFVALVDIGLTL